MVETPGLVLTPAQADVVALPWDTKAVVTAGAGAGKTTTLVHRIAQLTNAEELSAADLLVLSFSRAAVRELRGRLETLSSPAARVRAQTFDSWATSLLLQQDPQRTDLAGTTFDERIRRAREAIEAGVLDSFEYAPPAHVIVDEVQDLVGVRREMAEALLDWLGDDAGFTVVGDSAQSIYGFQVRDTEEEPNWFLAWVRASFGVTEKTLGDNFRARTPRARVALPFGPRLNAWTGNGKDVIEAARSTDSELRRSLLTLPHFGDLDDAFVQEALRLFDGTTAILCRTNAQALLISGRLAQAEVDHRVQRSPRERPAPAWLACLLAAAGGSTMTEERFVGIISAIPTSVNFDCARIWRALRRAALSGRDRINLTELCRLIATERLPDELTAPEDHPLVVSTVHNAKGLEFDRVLIVDPNAHSTPDDASLPDEVRLLYVAMTRARDDIYRLDSPNTWTLRKDKRLDRWYVHDNRISWRRYGIEAAGRDVCRERPPGAGEVPADPVATQRYLLQSTRVGAFVELRRLHELAAPEESPPYGIYHGDVPIGEVSERFRRDLWRLLKINGSWQVRRCPLFIRGLRIESLETVVGHGAISERHGLGSRGTWIAPRLVGLGYFTWDDREAVEKGHENS